MQGLPSLRIGCVRYLNAQPLIHGWQGPITFDHPNVLAAQLAAGELDVALVSSFEFLRNPVYTIVDEISIASAGSVYSVVLAHGGELDEIIEVELDPASLTSVNLLRCLLVERDLSPRFVSRGASPAPVTNRHAKLFIGDQAIAFRRTHGSTHHFWDLGQAWWEARQLPFVYAIWLMRPEVEAQQQIADALRALRDQNLAHLENVIAAQEPDDREFSRRYFCEYLRFGLGDPETAGLLDFRLACQKHGLLTFDAAGLPLV